MNTITGSVYAGEGNRYVSRPYVALALSKMRDMKALNIHKLLEGLRKLEQCRCLRPRASHPQIAAPAASLDLTLFIRDRVLSFVVYLGGARGDCPSVPQISTTVKFSPGALCSYVVRIGAFFKAFRAFLSANI